MGKRKRSYSKGSARIRGVAPRGGDEARRAPYIEHNRASDMLREDATVPQRALLVELVDALPRRLRAVIERSMVNPALTRAEAHHLISTIIDLRRNSAQCVRMAGGRDAGTWVGATGREPD